MNRGWELKDPDGGVLFVGTVAQTIDATSEARERLDAMLDHYRQIEGVAAMAEFDSVINDYIAMRELQLIAKFLSAYQSATGGWVESET